MFIVKIEMVIYMIKLYGSQMCSDCVNCKANFDKFKIEYEYIDINSSLKNLKEFLHYRDNYPNVFDRLIKIGDIGIPCLVKDDLVFTDWESYLNELGYKDLIYVSTIQTCSIDGKGC